MAGDIRDGVGNWPQEPMEIGCFGLSSQPHPRLKDSVTQPTASYYETSCRFSFASAGSLIHIVIDHNWFAASLGECVLGLGIRGKVSRLGEEAAILLKNSVGRPRLYKRSSKERIGVVFTEPSDMCVADRMMLYALVRGLRPERVLEIGVRWGGGARIIASALEDAGAGKAIGIDPGPEQFRAKPKELFGRYELVAGYSPDATAGAVEKLGGPVDLALIDAMHTHSHSIADLKGVLPFMAKGGHILLHDTFHQGIDESVRQVLSSSPDLVDCGFLTRFPEISDAPVAYQGLRLLRVGTKSSEDLIRDAYQREGKSEPAFSPDHWDWDHYWSRVTAAAE